MVFVIHRFHCTKTLYKWKIIDTFKMIICGINYVFIFYLQTGDVKPQTETLMQRYHRLKLEVTQLMTDIDQLKVTMAIVGNYGNA